MHSLLCFNALFSSSKRSCTVTQNSGHEKIGSRAKNIDQATSDSVFFFALALASFVRVDFTSSHFTMETPMLLYRLMVGLHADFYFLKCQYLTKTRKEAPANRDVKQDTVNFSAVIASCEYHVKKVMC